MSIGKNIVRQNMPGSLTVLHTVPVAKKTEIRSITACNNDEDNSAIWFLYLRPSGGSLVSLVPGTVQWVVPAGENIDYETWKVLGAGDTIEGYSPGNIDLHIDGAEVDA